MNYRSVFFSGLILTTSIVAQGAFSQEKKQEMKKGKFGISGFYYDKERQKYFSNEKSTFTIRPIGSKTYLEKIEVAVDGSDFASYQGTLKFNDEGPHQIKFRAVDPVWNWSPIQSFHIFVDKTAPKSNVVWKGPTYQKDNKLYINPNAVLNIIGQDNLSGVANIFWEGGDQKIARPFPGKMVFSKNTNYTYKVFAVDNVGNQEAPYDLTFTVDKKSPTTKAEIDGFNFSSKQNTYINTGTEIVLKSNDDLSGVQRIEYKINDGITTTYTRPIVLSEKKSTIKYRSIDNVGNRENWKDLSVAQDVKPPRINVDKKGKSFVISGKVYARPGFSFVANIYDRASGVKKRLVSFDGKTYNETKESIFKFDKVGETQFHLKAEDNVGNAEETNPYTIVIDNTPPVVKLKSSELLVKKGDHLLSSVPNRISFDIKDAGVGADKVQISYDGKQFVTLKSPIELSEWKQARRTLYYRGVDRLGNTGTAEKVDILVRTHGPKVELFVESEDLPNVPLSELKRRNK